MKKLTQEQVEEVFKNEGCELLDKYITSKFKLKYRCHCGNVAYIKLNDFRRGKRCGCGNARRAVHRRRPLEIVQKIFEEYGCKLLETEYINNHTRMKYICKCGRESMISLSCILMGMTCKLCGIEKNKRPLAKLNRKIKKKCSASLRVIRESTGQTKTSKTKELLGYGITELRDRLTNHPNWEKVKDGDWHMDHIFPITAFVEHGITDIKVINSLDNLQPLAPFDNMSKGNKYDKALFIEYLKEKGINL